MSNADSSLSIRRFAVPALVVALQGHGFVAAADAPSLESGAIVVEDLRDPHWRDMHVADTGQGVVQYTGDVAVPGGFVAYLSSSPSSVACDPGWEGGQPKAKE